MWRRSGWKNFETLKPYFSFVTCLAVILRFISPRISVAAAQGCDDVDTRVQRIECSLTYIL